MRLMKAAAAFAVMATFAAPQVASAQQPQAPAPAVQGTLLSISADGKSEGRPDMATINLGVTTEGQTAQAALAENGRRMTALTGALRRAGVA